MATLAIFRPRRIARWKYLLRHSGRLRTVTCAAFVGLVIVLGLRQIMQASIALSALTDAIWHYPGFPSLLVTYGVANDYFFSGHTAIAVLAATELARAGKRWITVGAGGIVLFEAVTVLVLRAHYTMDVFTGLVTGLYAAYLAKRIAASVQR